MKTKEFIEFIKNMGFKVDNGKYAIDIINERNSKIAEVSKEIKCFLWMHSHTFINLLEQEREDLFNLLVEYASTPIEERKEEKKYYIRNKYLAKYYNYLNYDTEDSNWSFSECSETFSFKTKFTLAELPDWVHEMLEQGHLVKEEVE